MIPTLIEAALRSLLVALTVWAGLRLFRVSNVPAQKIAWGLVLASAAAMPMLMRWQVLPPWMTFRVSAAAWRSTSEAPPAQRVRTDVTPAEGPPAARASLSAATSRPLGGGDRFPAPKISSGMIASAPHDPLAEAQPHAGAILAGDATAQTRFRLPEPATLAAIFYLAVCLLLLMRMGYGLVTAARLWLAAEPFVPVPWPNFETEPASGPGSDAGSDPGLGLRLRFSQAVSSPVTVGSGVLLPADCLGWDAEKLRIVLAHERAHVRQRDFYLQLGAGLYAAVFWFSPLGWWLKRKLSDLGEAISDRAGLEEAASRASYAQVLLEFAALPRPTLIGVAMARNSNLSHRIDRFLDESRFRLAFAGSRRRMLLAVLLVPVALFAATALVRVEAAASAQAAPPAPAQAPSPAAAPNPATAPSPAAMPDTEAAPAAPAVSADQASAPAAPAQAGPQAPAAPAAPSAPADAAPMPPALVGAVIAPDAPAAEIYVTTDDKASPPTMRLKVRTRVGTNTYTVASAGKGSGAGRGYAYSYSSDGDDSYVLVQDRTNGHVSFSGDWNNGLKAEIDKAEKLTSGNFLLFTRGGKTYFVDDPTIVAQIEAMYKPMEELGRQQEALGKQQEVLGKQQEEMGRKQERASVPTPDISKEMAKLNEAVAKLDAKKGSTVTQEELAEIEAKIGDIQGRLGELQGEMGEKQGEFGEAQGKLGEQQGKLGEEQGKLGEQQGKLAEEADRKVKSIIDQSMSNGKAKPVE